MPELGEIKKGIDIGYKSHGKHIWAACLDCGKERWVGISKGLPKRLHCRDCGCKYAHKSGSENHNWKGGRHLAGGGYIRVLLSPDNFFFPMVVLRRCNLTTGYVLEHRLVMAQHLNRCLQPWEIVHHKNGIRDDNRIENLELATDASHRQITCLETILKKQQKRIAELENRTTLLEAELTLLRQENPVGVRGK